MNARVRLALLLLPCLTANAAQAGSISVRVINDKNEPVTEAVTYLRPNGPIKSASAENITKVDQVGKSFVPHVSVMQYGGSVSFPNFDNIRHHVYSFSPARKFEIPLYEGVPATPIEFPKSGVVALGCNIHDWMAGYIVVTETPWHGITAADGSTTIADIPPGTYEIETWHEKLHGKPQKTRQKVTVPASGTVEVSFTIKQKKVFSAFRGAAARGGGYR